MFLQNSLFTKPNRSKPALRQEDINWWKKELFYATTNKPNETWTWNPSDTEIAFRKGVAKFRLANTEYPWTPESFNYKFNSYGFRGPELTTYADFKILVSGCSYTEGIGLPYETTWPELLSKKIANSVAINLGQGGHSSDYVVRSIYKTIDTIKPNLVAVLWPPMPRHEAIVDTACSQESPSTNNFSRLYADDAYTEYQQLKNEAMLSSICLAANVPLLQIRGNLHVPGLPKPGDILLARDNMHSGPWWQESVANSMYELFQSGRSAA